jgi:nucleoprotein TPR
MEVSELHKSKRQLIELVEQKDLEISEKNATLKSYLDKIVSCSHCLCRLCKQCGVINLFCFHFWFVIVKVNSSNSSGQREARVSEMESELARSQAACARLKEVSTML